MVASQVGFGANLLVYSFVNLPQDFNIAPLAWLGFANGAVEVLNWVRVSLGLLLAA